MPDPEPTPPAAGEARHCLHCRKNHKPECPAGEAPQWVCSCEPCPGLPAPDAAAIRRDALEEAAAVYGDGRHCCEDCPCSGKADEVRALASAPPATAAPIACGKCAGLETALRTSAEYFVMLERATGVEHGQLKVIRAALAAIKEK